MPAFFHHIHFPFFCCKKTKAAIGRRAHPNLSFVVGDLNRFFENKVYLNFLTKKVIEMFDSKRKVVVEWPL